MSYTDAYVEKQIAAIQRVRNLHHPTKDGRHCMACSLLVASVTKGLGTAQYPCATILFLDGEQ